MYVFCIAIMTGISLGALYFLIAIGLSITIGLMGFLNLSHGTLFLTGAYFGIWVAKATDQYVYGLIAGAVAAGLVGLFIQQGFLKRLYRRDFEQIVLSFGFIYIIQNVHLWIYGPYSKVPLLPEVLSKGVIIGNFIYPWYRVLIIGVGIVVCAGLYWMERRTKIGSLIRAGMDNPRMVAGLGINLFPLMLGMFFLGALLAGFAGIIGAPVLGGVSIASSVDALTIALAVSIVAGVGSIVGTMVGAATIGIATSLSAVYAPFLSIFIVYIVMILVLLFRPTGLWGRQRQWGY
jgi:branched-chain amino acid transport system permease protein